jgi:hypothetical protein
MIKEIKNPILQREIKNSQSRLVKLEGQKPTPLTNDKKTLLFLSFN